jgi:MSHA biogenesis protein MshJ
MNSYSLRWQEWLKKRSPRDRMYLFLSGFAFLYLLYFIFFLHPLLMQKKEIQQKVLDLQTQQTAIEQKVDTIHSAIKNPLIMQRLQEQQRLSSQLARMQQQLDSLKPAISSAENLPSVASKILNEKPNNTILISLEELPVESWPPQSTLEQTEKTEKPAIEDTFSGLYQHILQIEFQNDYLNTINYLERLEKISSHMYWDKMDYTVLQYPNATVVIKFHVLSLEKS